MKCTLFRALGLLAIVAGLFSCSTPSPSPPYGPSNGLRSGDSAINRNSVDEILNNPARPGLATGWGHELASPVTGQSFVRASAKPAGTDAIYYNDRAGIKAMAASTVRVEAMQTAAGGLVEWGVKGNRGFLESYKEGYKGLLMGSSYQRRLVAGEAGSTYTVVVRNRSKSTLEIVASVDGLDVMDGKTASFSKRGYLADPGETLEIDGFRTSNGTVAAFKFSGVADSYANLRHGDTRNVGVLGLAVFTRKGIDPWRTLEVARRDRARAFAEAP